MTFKTRKIRHRPGLKPLKKAKQISSGLLNRAKSMPSKTKSFLVAGVLVIFGVVVVFKVCAAAYRAVSEWSPKSLIFALGADLKKDEHGYTNILLLGDGGHKRDGADLIDTIMVASIDYEKNSVSLFSIPRDFYAEADKTIGYLYSGKINEVYRNHKKATQNDDENFQLFKRVVGKLVNLNIQYYVRVDFNGFAEVVDSLGGITVDVQQDIYDPYYPNETDDGYTIFSVTKGIQEMDGETSLKFVRSRKTTSDFDRSARQQLVIEAIQQKALSTDVLTSADKIRDLYEAIQHNLNTDLSIREMLALGGFAKQMDRSRMVRKLIHDDPGQEGGFLYTPERELYGGEFVLIPYGDNYDLIHKYADLVFNHREFFYRPTTIKILNATKLSGIARAAAYQLIRFGFDVQSIDNHYDPDGEKQYLEKSLIRFGDYTQDKKGLIKAENQEVLEVLQDFVKGVVEADPSAYLVSDEEGKKVYKGAGHEISVILGNDYDVFLVN